MIRTHQTPTAPWLWPLRGAKLLPAADVGRWLVVVEGNVWLTRSVGDAGLSDDVWLAAGQRQWLAAGSEWVIEAWPAAQLELVLAPPFAPTLSGAGGWLESLRLGLRHARQRLGLAQRQPSTSAFA